jgi:hypothetical protein
MASPRRSTSNPGRLGEELYVQPERSAFLRGTIDPRDPVRQEVSHCLVN